MISDDYFKIFPSCPLNSGTLIPRAHTPTHTILPERFRWQYAEARLLQHLPDFVTSSRHGVGFHFTGAFMVRRKLQVSREIGDGKAVAFFFLNLGDVRNTVLLFMHDPTQELFED